MGRLLKKSMLVVGLVLLAIVAGVLSAIVRLRHFESVDDVRVGPWHSSTLIGSQQAGYVLRALVAVNGILALNREQAIYFSAERDSRGELLDGGCRYRVMGHDLPARWWSLTAYGADRFLIANPQHRYSVTKESVRFHADGSFEVTLALSADTDDWIAVQPGRFSLTLRAYGPDSRLAVAPANDALPSIEKVSCP